MRLIFPMSDDMMGVQKIFEERPTAKAKAGGSFLSDTEGAQCSAVAVSRLVLPWYRYGTLQSEIP